MYGHVVFAACQIFLFIVKMTHKRKMRGVFSGIIVSRTNLLIPHFVSLDNEGNWTTLKVKASITCRSASIGKLEHLFVWPHCYLTIATLLELHGITNQSIAQ